MSACQTCLFSPGESCTCTHLKRYLRLIDWARQRYTINGWLVAYVGPTPTRYQRISDAAWQRYMA